LQHAVTAYVGWVLESACAVLVFTGGLIKVELRGVEHTLFEETGVLWQGTAVRARWEGSLDHLAVLHSCTF